MVAGLPHDNTGVVIHLTHIVWVTLKIDGKRFERPYPGSCAPYEHDTELVSHFWNPRVIYVARRPLPGVYMHTQKVAVHFPDHHEFFYEPFCRSATVPHGIFIHRHMKSHCLSAIEHLRFSVDPEDSVILRYSPNPGGNGIIIHRFPVFIFQNDLNSVKVRTFKCPDIGSGNVQYFILSFIAVSANPYRETDCGRRLLTFWREPWIPVYPYISPEWIRWGVFYLYLCPDSSGIGYILSVVENIVDIHSRGQIERHPPGKPTDMTVVGGVPHRTLRIIVFHTDCNKVGFAGF